MVPICKLPRGVGARKSACLKQTGSKRWLANMLLTRRYLYDTVTLQTEFVTSSGSAAVLIVFMPLHSENAAEMRSSRSSSSQPRKRLSGRDE